MTSVERSNKSDSRGKPRPQRETRLPSSYLWVYVFGALLIVGFTSYHVSRGFRDQVTFWQDRQMAIVEERAFAVSNWLAERQADAEVLAALPSVRAFMLRPPGKGPSDRSRLALERELRLLLDRFTNVYGYTGIYLLDTEGRLYLQSSGSPPLASPKEAVARTLAHQGNTLIGLLGDSPQTCMVLLSVPVLMEATADPAAREIAGVVAMEIPASKSLFPILAAPLLPTQTGETLLVRRDGNEVTFISPLRYAPSLMAFLHRPLGGNRLAAVTALLVGESSGEFVDYRGEPVLAATQRIPLTGWGLVRKIDRAEALAQFQRTALLECVAAGFAILVLGGLLLGYRKGQLSRSLAAQVAQQRDILQLKQYAQEIVDSVPAGLLVLSSDLRVLSTNRPFLEFFNLSASDVIGRRLDEVIQAEGPPYRAPSVLEGERAAQSVLINVTVSGRSEKRPARVTIASIAQLEGEGRLLVVIEDQSESERLRSVAEASERRMRDLVQTVDAVVWEADAETFLFTFVSHGAEHILGYPVTQWLSEPHFWENHIEPQERDRIVALRRAAIARGGDYELEYRMVGADGRIVWLRDRVRVIQDSEGHSRQLRGVMLDITHEKRGEEERARLGSAVEQAAEAVLMTDLEGTIVYVNPAFERVSGYIRDEVIGKNPRLLKSGKQEASFYRSLWDAITRGESWEGHFINRRKDGTEYEAEAVISPVRDASGRVVNYVAVQRDVTRERQLEEQVRQSQKIEAVGRLAGGIAHDFNNLLTIIGGYSDLLLDTFAADDSNRAYVTEIKKASDRAASLTRQLLAFSRRQVLAPQVLDLNSVVTNMHNMMRRLIGEDIDLVTLPGHDLRSVKVDPGQIEQVILNLVVNARDAMPQGGKITLETANVELNEKYAGGHFPVTPGPYAMLAVSDTGCGMDVETQSHIFEPFFTTKERGKGTGLGLAVVYGIVKQSGGYVWVYSEVNRGTTFKVYFPCVEEQTVPVEADSRSKRRSGGGETILLVEDEGAVRSLVRGLLETAGYTVLEARNGEDALLVSEQYKGRIHLLVTDVVMPEMSGPELVEHLTLFHREMKVLYMSGYTDDAILHHGVLDAGAAFLQKPFTPDGLARKVREILAAT